MKKKRCPACNSINIILFGKTSNNKQRFKCSVCSKTYVWKDQISKIFHEQHWFKLWVKEGYSVRQLEKISGHSKAKLYRIIYYWLNQTPKEQTKFDNYKYLIYDGTYFHKNGCLINLMDAKTQNIISNIYTVKEGFNNTYTWFMHLKTQGLNPLYVVMDGEQSVMRCVKTVWPQIKIQRCLWHIQREGMRWLRTHPKTQAGKNLRCLLSTLCAIKNVKERNIFINSFKNWLIKYKAFVKSLPSTDVAFKDLKKTVALIKNALPDMFHYLKEPVIPSTTNALEGFYSRLKADYNKHRGLTQKHKIHYLKWYCFYKNNNNL
jgi:hypothetical protein